MTENQKICFVVMGFGKKTDFESGRTLNLDATYNSIIKRAAESQDMRCIRADEKLHSGTIDSEMYEMLLRADLVIADISTGNPNALYELGVRHALRPNSTIIMTESEGKLYFDLNHTSTFKYVHLGEDIGFTEANRATSDLSALISESIKSKKPDSPVYTYLPYLNIPTLSDKKFQELLDKAEYFQDNLSNYILNGNNSIDQSLFDDAVKYFNSANDMKPNDSYIIQRLTLSTYKSKNPSELIALTEAIKIIDQLEPKKSNDPETLGLCGAIYKRLWALTEDRSALDLAINFYGRGFEVRGDYYNGENLALCHDIRSQADSNEDEKIFDRLSAKKTREQIVLSLSKIFEENSFNERSDKKWILATLANSYFSLGNNESGIKFENLFLTEKLASWEIDTYNDTKNTLQKLNLIDQGPSISRL